MVERGLYMKHCRVEVYLLEFKLSMDSNQNEEISEQFSRLSTVGKVVIVQNFCLLDSILIYS